MKNGIFMRKKKESEETQTEKKSRLLSKFETMESGTYQMQNASRTSSDDAGMFSSQTGQSYLKRRMTEEIVLWKKVYTSHVTEEKNYSRYTQRLEALFSQINPDASLNIEFTNPQSIHSYQEVEEKVLQSFKGELFSFLVAGAYDTYLEVETTKNGTNVFVSRLVEENLLEGRDELIRTLKPVTGTARSSYEVFERFTDAGHGKDMVLIGVIHKIEDETARTKNTVNKIRSIRKDITV